MDSWRWSPQRLGAPTTSPRPLPPTPPRIRRPPRRRPRPPRPPRPPRLPISSGSCLIRPPTRHRRGSGPALPPSPSPQSSRRALSAGSRRGTTRHYPTGPVTIHSRSSRLRRSRQWCRPPPGWGTGQRRLTRRPTSRPGASRT
ncbi:hypothetical protein FF096_17400 [Micromonospora sp. CP22]|nr:hypothetical protein [Micromonospora sp. CP22]